MPNTLSQLKEMDHKWTDNPAAPSILNVLYSDTNKFVIDTSMTYNITFVKIDSKFKRKLIIDYIKD